MLEINKALEKFKQLPNDIILEVDSDRVADILEELKEKYGFNLNPVIIFMVVGDLLAEDVLQYLQKEFGVSEKKAKAISKEINEKIIDPLLERLHFFNPSPDKTSIKPEQEKKLVLKIFEKDLLRDLNNNPIIIRKINSRIFSLLSQDLGFKKSMENALYCNLQKLTHKHFILEGKLHAPSVRNWIRDFIKKHGTSLFDNVDLTDYATNSENGKELDAEERKLVTRLLILYRNVKFFPDSMASDDGEGWEIIPVEDSIPEEKRPISGPPKTPAEKRIDELKQEEEKYGQDSLAGRAIEEEISHEKRIEDLRIEANKYPAGSLERRALEEEIRKLAE
ncbi:MAG: hypothetical protein U9R06_02040 [Patescibacteria group bacterium]|nr:hypothetical protein [Patescibacteria group bacterium]